MNLTEQIKAALFGVATGDALGVPVEFTSRESLRKNPVTDMRGYGSHRQPVGTWSDDSSLTFCLAEMLSDAYDLSKLANRFINWKDYSYWTPHGDVFDIGIATSAAIDHLRTGGRPELAGGRDELSNGNGSLMRILPLAFYLRDKATEERFRLVQEVSSLTHAHIRSVFACFIYTELALQLIRGKDKITAFRAMQQSVNSFIDQQGSLLPAAEVHKFQRLLGRPDGPAAKLIHECTEEEIRSSGYVLDTLEASFWCLMQTGNYADAVLKAVNLGQDTDTTGAVTGGLAGLCYGYSGIPEPWRKSLARAADIDHLCQRMAQALNNNQHEI